MAITTPVLRMFGQSPIRPLQEHMRKVHECTKALLPFFEAVLQQDWAKAEQAQEHIVSLEHEADLLKKQLRLNLPKGLFLPVARTDLLEILAVQDRIANKAQDISGLILGRRMQIPAELKDDYLKFLQRSIDASKQARKAVFEMDELLETGFRGNEVTIVEDMIHQLDAIEQDSDSMQVEIRRKLYELEKDLPPVDVMFLYKTVEWTGELADRAQMVGEQLQLLLAR